MNRLLQAIQAMLQHEATIGWIDSFLLCLGFTCTVASTAPALARICRRPGDRS
ncbi:MAG TPA: hypothetical protein VLF19_09270 [Methylomirabilota bacterium]|nr:hypothetical protein [Methylomirabilota bacterium]